MKPGVRALGIAESVVGTTSVHCGAVVTARGRLDGLAFESRPVGGLEATDAVADLWAALDRADVRFLLIGGVAPAWYDVLDLPAIAARVPVPLLAITFERGGDLAPHLETQFGGPALAERRRRYRSLTAPTAVDVGDDTVYVRSWNLVDRDPADVCRHFTLDGGRPEPIRVARLAARARHANRCR